MRKQYNQEESFLCFWGESPFSQWSPSVFVADGVTYSHVEQYMMAQKAIMFGDEETRQKIMAAKHPREQKRLGGGFDKEIWAKQAKEISYDGNRYKFEQNPEMLETLIKTDGYTLVEASTQDKIWGIGLDENDPRCRNRETWLGKNWLGEVLTKLRDDLIQIHGSYEVIVHTDFKDYMRTKKVEILTKKECDEIREKHRSWMGPMMPSSMSSYHRGSKANCEKWITEEFPKLQKEWDERAAVAKAQQAAKELEEKQSWIKMMKNKIQKLGN